MKRRVLMIVAGLMFLACASNAQAFELFGKRFGGGCCQSSCCEEVSCCDAEPTCGCAAEPTCAVEPSCGCEVEPSCGCEAAPRCCGRRILFPRLHALLHHKKHRHASACGCEVEPSCGCEVEPSCGCGY